MQHRILSQRMHRNLLAAVFFAWAGLFGLATLASAPCVRADVVAYLRTLAASPLPLPTQAQVKAASAAAAPAASATPATPAAPSIDTLFASADVTKGQAVFTQQCSACHTNTKGGAAGIGPNLYGIMFDQPGKQRQACAVFHAGIGGVTAEKLRLRPWSG